MPWILIADGRERQKPYMTGLGMPASVTALVWASGPLSGAFLQPFFAMLSDRCQHPWGRRRPLIVGGASCVALSLLGLATAEDVMTWGGLSGGPHPPGPLQSSPLKVQVAVGLWAALLNVAMQPLQVGVRALQVDSFPALQQPRASAWSARFNGLGAVTISSLAYFDAPVLPWLGDTTFKALCVVAVLALFTTVALACLVACDPPSEHVQVIRSKPSLRSLLAELSYQVRNLPPVTRQVCKIQLCAWLGWFSVLYYTTTYIYEIFVVAEHVHLDPEIFGGGDPRLIAVGRQAGRQTSFIFSCVTFGAALLLVARSHVRFPARSESVCSAAPVVWIYGLTLGRLWQLANALFAVLMFLSCFVSTVPAAMVIMGTLGVSWAVASWAPFALVSAEIATLRAQSLGLSDKTDEADLEEGHAASIVAIHNMAISLPQVFAALGCSLLFKIVEFAGRDDPAAFALKFAGIMAAVATWMGKDLH